MTAEEIIVLGGGIAGKTAALGLAQQGKRVLHLAPDLATKKNGQTNKLDSSSWDSRVYAISRSSKDLFKKLQVWDALPQDRIQAVKDMRIFGDRGHPSDFLHFSAFQGTVPELAWIIEAEQIEIALDLASSFQRNLTRVSAQVLSLETSIEGVSLETSQGTFQAPLLIAADGSNSSIRSIMGIDTFIQAYDHTAVIANFKCTKPNLQTAYQWFLPGGDILAMLPLPDQKVSMVWSTSTNHAKELVCLCGSSPEEFSQGVLQQTEGKLQQVLGDLSLLSTATSYPLKKLQAKRLLAPETNPRVILIGDAAHVMHPLAGQGLNLGLRDIRDLLEVMDNKEKLRALNDPVLLRRFERMRVGDIQTLLSATHHLHQLFLSKSTTSQWLRNTGMSLLNKSPTLKRQLILRALG
ncbi:MAG: FAD-dependent monooxygenase [Betaproteobacteria bacterium]